MTDSRPKTAADIFRILREFMQESDIGPNNYTEQNKVWDVLTALRGPDNPGLFPLKQATTALIRGKLLGRKSSARDMADVQFEDSPKFVDRRLELALAIGEEIHFRRHVTRAFYALELNWEENNGDVDV